MHDLEKRTGPEVTGEVPTTEAYIETVYGTLGIEAALGSYLDGAASEDDVAILLATFSDRLADAALERGSLEVKTVRFGIDHLTGNMNKVCNAKLGSQPPKTLTEALLLKLGMVEPEPRRYIRELDDRYWTKQFPEEYADEQLAKRLPNETDQQYLARHIRTSIHGLLFAPFTFMR